MSFMGGLLSEVCCRRIGQANTEWYQHFLPRSISIYMTRYDGTQMKGATKQWCLTFTSRKLKDKRNSQAARPCESTLRCIVSARSPAWCSSALVRPCSQTQSWRVTTETFRLVAEILNHSNGGWCWSQAFSEQCDNTGGRSGVAYLTLNGDSTERPSKAHASLVKMLHISAHWFVSNRPRYGEFSMPWRR